MTPKKLLGGAGILAALVLFQAATSHKLVCRHLKLVSAKLTAPIRIAHISDLHESRFGDGQRELIRALREMKPDLIFITGDIIEDDDSASYEMSVIATDNPARPLLEALPEIAPCFMVLGNHECNIPQTDILSAELRDLGITVLHRANKEDPDMSCEIAIHGQKLLICGADDPYFDRMEIHKNSLSERFAEDRDRCGERIVAWRERLKREYASIKNEKRLTLLLSHRPEEFELYRELNFDVAFSGHAHGGQWRLPPFLNGIYAPNQGIFPKHAGGVYHYEQFAHIVSRGLSKKRMVRIFNPPEVWCVDITPREG